MLPDGGKSQTICNFVNQGTGGIKILGLDSRAKILLDDRQFNWAQTQIVVDVERIQIFQLRR